MKKSILLLSLLFQTAFSLQAQNSADLAMALYNKAENAYNISDFESSLSYLGQAEQALGKTNPKLLYLKVKTLDMLTRIDFKKAEQLKQTTSSFLTLTNKATYPADKYQEVLGIDFETKQKIQKEEADYNNLKSSEKLADFEAFNIQYPQSKYSQRINDKYKELKDRQKLTLARKLEDQWKAENLKTYKKYRAVGGILAGTGIPCLAGGAAMTIGGWIGYYSRDGYYGGSDPYSWDEVDERTANTQILVGSIGPVLFVYGMVGTIVGSIRLQWARSIKADAKAKGINLSFHTDRVQNQPTVGLAVKF